LINEFWPISLLNAIIKIITKVLANRLRPHIHLLVDQVQSAFTKNRYILDSVACAHEIIAATHNYDIEAVFLKLDFEKAFDSVSLDFLFELLRARRFGQWWIDWINICLFSGTSSILVNGKPGNYIKCRKGLQQGDPLSTYLFILVADSFTRILSLAGTNSCIQKVGSSPWPNDIVRLHYADEPFLCRETLNLSFTSSYSFMNLRC